MRCFRDAGPEGAVRVVTRRAVWPGRSMAVMATVCLLAAPAAAVEPTTERVSVSSTGAQTEPFTHSFGGPVSANGRFVAFVSSASNLVDGDTNGVEDIFLRDRVSGQTQRVNVSSTGNQAIVGNPSFDPFSAVAGMSASGRFVVFDSSASNLVPGDTNDGVDVFVRDTVSGHTERVSVSSNGAQTKGPPGFGTPPTSHAAGVSPDGRFITFESDAPNLVAGDTNRTLDVFVHDRGTGQTRRVSVSSTGTQGESASFAGGVSASGRFVVFTSRARGLVRGDPGGRPDAFVRNRLTGQTRMVSVSSSETPANGAVVGRPWISPDGRFVAFSSRASNLVRGDTNGKADVFVRDRSTGQTRRVSVSSSEVQANERSFARGMSANGRFVAFDSPASNLVANDTNGTVNVGNASDVFVRDRSTGQTRRVSLSSTGAQASASFGGAISADGRFVAFTSAATDLVEGDTNEAADVFIRGPLQ